MLKIRLVHKFKLALVYYTRKRGIEMLKINNMDEKTSVREVCMQFLWFLIIFLAYEC